MAGPHPPNQGLPPAGGPADSPSQAAPGSQHGGPKLAEAAPASAAYPGPLPPPVPYPKRPRRWLVVVIAVLAVALVAAMVAAIWYGVSEQKSAAPGKLSDAAATKAVQGYLDALENRDIDTIARNTMCGIYDAVSDRRSDQALAKLSSDAFRKQFSEVDVTSIDKIVYWSNYQAQVLFSMRVVPASGGAARENVQGIAQLLAQRNQILVCSYVLRAAGAY